MLVETGGVTDFTPGCGNFEAAKSGEQALRHEAREAQRRNLSREFKANQLVGLSVFRSKSSGASGWALSIPAE
jgi:hypothetical protein